MARKGNTEMTETIETAPVSEAPKRDFLKFQKLVPKLPVILLDGTEEKRLAEYQRVVVVDPINEESFAALQNLVGGNAEQCDAFAKYVTSRNYRAAVDAIYADSNVLSPQLVDKVCEIMSQLGQFAENSKSENKAKWLAGFRDKKDGALKLLDRAKIALATLANAEEIGDLD